MSVWHCCYKLDQEKVGVEVVVRVGLRGSATIYFPADAAIALQFAVSSKYDPVAGMKNERPRHITRCAHDPASGGRSDQSVMSPMFMRQTSADAPDFIAGWHGCDLWCNIPSKLRMNWKTGSAIALPGQKYVSRI